MGVYTGVYTGKYRGIYTDIHCYIQRYIQVSKTHIGVDRVVWRGLNGCNS